MRAKFGRDPMAGLKKVTLKFIKFEMSLIKFADDTALIGFISKDDDSAFLRQVDSFVNHCDANYLELNVSKTKEMVIDFRQTRPDPQPVDIKGSAVATVDTYKYLGIVLNNKLSWGDHVDFIVKRLNSRMYCLRKLNSINLLFGLPRFLFPGNSILSILLPIYPSSFLRRFPYHLSLASRVFSPNFPT